MDEAEIRLFATLREGRFEKARIKLEGPSSVKEILKSFEIDPEEVAIIFVNKKHAGLDTAVHPGDSVSLFPKVGGG